MMKGSKLLGLLFDAGFTDEQAQALVEHFSQRPHTHTADQITDFEDKVLETIEEQEP